MNRNKKVTEAHRQEFLLADQMYREADEKLLEASKDPDVEKEYVKALLESKVKARIFLQNCFKLLYREYNLDYDISYSVDTITGDIITLGARLNGKLQPARP